jgi:hypothetical protein
VSEGPKGEVEIFANVVRETIEYRVKSFDQHEVFNNLGEAYIETGALTSVNV